MAAWGPCISLKKKQFSPVFSPWNQNVFWVFFFCAMRPLMRRRHHWFRNFGLLKDLSQARKILRKIRCVLSYLLFYNLFHLFNYCFFAFNLHEFFFFSDNFSAGAFNLVCFFFFLKNTTMERVVPKGLGCQKKLRGLPGATPTSWKGLTVSSIAFRTFPHSFRHVLNAQWSQ